MDIIRLDEGWRFDEGHFMDQPSSGIVAVTPPVRHKKGKVMDYVPDKRDTRYQWYLNLSNNVVAEAVKFGGAPADATAMKALVDGVIAKMDATAAAQDAVDGARLIERNTETAALAELRTKVRNWKTLSGWAASGSEAVLQLRSSGPAFDPLAYKTVLKVQLVPGGVRVDFTKKGVDGVIIYMRVRGSATWRKIGMDTEAPYIDSTPLASPGVAEVREYMARGFLHDEEIGQDSDVVSITFAG